MKSSLVELKRLKIMAIPQPASKELRSSSHTLDVARVLQLLDEAACSLTDLWEDPDRGFAAEIDRIIRKMELDLALVSD